MDEEKKPQSRVDNVHGGEIVEAVSQTELASFNDADCKHVNTVLDPSETEFTAYVCTNPDCNEIFLYDRL